jgi:membrane associated rhomboid family serine protease
VFGIAVIRGAKLLARAKGKVTTATRDFLLIFFAGVIIGGLFQWGWWAATNAQFTATGAVGASGGASALFAAGAWAIGGRDKMIQFGLGWVVINAVMVLLENFIGMNIAWPAHIGGYIAGMILAPLFVKSNATRLSML